MSSAYQERGSYQSRSYESRPSSHWQDRSRGTPAIGARPSTASGRYSSGGERHSTASGRYSSGGTSSRAPVPNMKPRPKAAAGTPEARILEDSKNSRQLKRLLKKNAKESLGTLRKRRKVDEENGYVGDASLIDLEDEDDEPEEVEDEDDDFDDEEDEEERKERSQVKHQLTKRWNLLDPTTAFVLDHCTIDELRKLQAGNWRHNPRCERRSPGDQLNHYLTQQREAHLRTGPRDAVSVFASQWKIPHEQESVMRTLSYEVLTRVIDAYNEELPLEEEIAGATEDALNNPDLDDDDDDNADPEKYEKKLKDGPRGHLVLSRFSRLELIPPDADGLVCGDANLTFSLRLAEHRASMGHSGLVVATTFEDRKTLVERYPIIADTIQKLEDLGATVIHEVDCTRLATDERFAQWRAEGQQFGSAYYNFPHAGAVRGFFDGHPYVNWRHTNLMQLFFRALRSVLRPNAQVRVSSNANATGVRAQSILDAGMHNEFQCGETVPFNEWVLHRYVRSYGDKRDSTKKDKLRNEGDIYKDQKGAADMVYTFWYVPTMDNKDLPPPKLQLPPDIKTLWMGVDCCGCGLITEHELRDLRYGREGVHFRSGHHQFLDGDAKHAEVKKLYDRFISEVSGRHVG